MSKGDGVARLRAGFKDFLASLSLPLSAVLLASSEESQLPWCELPYGEAHTASN